MQIRTGTAAAPSSSANEDAVFVVGDLVGVLDGVTAPNGLDTGCRHSVAWYVEQLAECIGDAHTRNGASALTDVLAAGIEAVRHRHGGSCDLSHPGTHAATVCLLRQRCLDIDYLLLCDTRLVLDRHGKIEVLSDPRFAQAVAKLRKRAFTNAPAVGSAEQVGRVRSTTLARRSLMNVPDGYWIAAADPDAPGHAITGRIATTDVGRAALLTDGAADAVERYDLVGWSELLDIAEESGPDEVIRMVRKAELADPDGQVHPRYKAHDDATIALCTFERSPS